MLNEETFEFGQARLKLKESLRFTLRSIGDSTSYLLEDEATGRFFRLGLPQYTFLTMLDGRRTVSTAMMMCATLLREEAIGESETASLCKWAIESGLVESESGNSAKRREEQQLAEQKQKLLSWANPLMLRFSLFNPDRLVNALSRYTGFLISPIGGLIWLCVVLHGFSQLAIHWTAFYTNRVQAFGIDDLLWIAVSWVALKIAHELAHALVCARFGGRTHSCGILLLLLIPMPFVDLTSSWRFDNKWHRILTSAAGMLMEVFIAAIACVIWTQSPPGPLQYHAGNLIISATLYTLLFNVNPLMRFDGYYMLADLLEIPNMAIHGRQWIKGVFAFLYFGAKRPALMETGYRALAVRMYGVLAMLWSITVMVGLTLAANSLIEGFGFLVAVSGLVMWVGIPLIRLIRYLVMGAEFSQPNRLWFATATTFTVLAIGSFLHFCPAPSVMSAPVVIDYEPLSIVRSRTFGFAERLHVRDGDSVQRGDLLVSLSNPEMRHELASLQTDIEITQLKISTLQTKDEISRMQLEQQSLGALLKRRQELETHIANLEVRAPQSGTILAREFATVEGKYFSPGDEFLSIGTPGMLHAIALARQTDIGWIDQEQPLSVEIFLWGRDHNQSIPGRVKHIDPRARDKVVHEAFAATAGGPLDVVSRQQTEGNDSAADALKLTQPRVAIKVELSDASENRLRAGQTGELVARSRNTSMGDFLQAKATRFISENTRRTHGL